MPGKPDVVFPKSKIAVFADGDFWHGNNFIKWKKEVPGFWKKKISNNIKRDREQTLALKNSGYKVLRFWGHQIKKDPLRVITKIEKTLKSQNQK